MKYYSDVTNEKYDTIEELNTAEAEFKALISKKDERREEIVTLAKEISEKKSELDKKLVEFIKEYGTTKFNEEEGKAIRKALYRGVLSDESYFYPFRFFANFK